MVSSSKVTGMTNLQGWYVQFPRLYKRQVGAEMAVEDVSFWLGTLELAV